MNFRYLIICFSILPMLVSAQEIKLKVTENKSLAYDEVIAAYQKLDSKYKTAKLLEYGKTDIGKPLHLFVISKSAEFNPVKLKESGKAVLLILNGIHPGEPEGIDASISLSDKILKENPKVLDSVVVCIIPIYNVDGSLNRSCCSRANQNGPDELGFRGNARNLDLNRDFIKCDSENARSFTRLFREWKPDVFIDTHTSNGADYQYVITLITTQHNKMQAELGRFIKNKVEPDVYAAMKLKGWDMSPYVYTKANVPDSGLIAFLETPRYSTGYAALYNTIGFIIETHMFKPFEQRYSATYDFLDVVLNYTYSNCYRIKQQRKMADSALKKQKEYTLEWVLDTNTYSQLLFKGYEAQYLKSELSGKDRLFYNRNKPFEKQIPFFDTYKSSISVTAPLAYIIPQAWKEVIALLQFNKVEMHTIQRDTLINIEVYYIEDYKTTSSPYEGHYLHSNVRLKTKMLPVFFYKGDIIVYVNQEANRYIVETLEPQATDSYFNWNFFDEILMQKEWFSDYIFEEKAISFLNENPEVKREFEALKKTDENFANTHWAQLYYIYKQTPYYENSHMRYPIYRIVK
jgi:hypothetical protein